jgi:basic membrane protein A and related proteins
MMPSHAFSALKIGLVLDKGGKDDKSFNASAYKGAVLAQERLRMDLKYVEATDDNAFEMLLRSFAQKDFDIIFAIGVSQATALKKVAAQFPKKKFAIVDAEVNAPNVRSILFEEHEGSYVVGALAALVTQTGKLGFIGGRDIPLIHRFQLGFESGAKKINPKIVVYSNYIGVTNDAWNNPPKAKELALIQYAQGADIIFGAAGASGSGLFDAAEEKQKYAIGVDSNQNMIKPGRIITSMLKRVDTAVFLTCSDLISDAFTSGIKRYGLLSGGVDYAIDDNNRKLLSFDLRQKIDQLKEDIVTKKIIVPDYYKLTKK